MNYKVTYIHKFGRVVNKTFDNANEANAYFDRMLTKIDIRKVYIREVV